MSYVLSGVVVESARDATLFASNAVLTCAGLYVGLFWSTRAAKPATIGAEKDVPLAKPYAAAYVGMKPAVPIIICGAERSNREILCGREQCDTRARVRPACKVVVVRTSADIRTGRASWIYRASRCGVVTDI